MKHKIVLILGIIGLLLVLSAFGWLLYDRVLEQILFPRPTYPSCVVIG